MNLTEPKGVYYPKRTSPHLNPNVQRWLHDLTKLPPGTLSGLAEYLVAFYRTSDLNSGPPLDALITITLLLTEMEKPTLAEMPAIKY